MTTIESKANIIKEAVAELNLASKKLNSITGKNSYEVIATSVPLGKTKETVAELNGKTYEFVSKSQTQTRLNTTLDLKSNVVAIGQLENGFWTILGEVVAKK